MQHVFIIGAKGISFYGGYESFLQKLLEYHKDKKEIKYHVACKKNGTGAMDITKMNGVSDVTEKGFSYGNAECFFIDVNEKLGSAQAITYDVAALKECCRQIIEYNIQNPIVYILACRIGPFIRSSVKLIHRYGGKVFVNPDGHEWLRKKWSAPIRKYWKESERLMVKLADLLICDSKHIETYIQREYKRYKPNTTFIAYGSETRKSQFFDDDTKFVQWYESKGVKPFEYYLVVGRFVPENNYETMIREFMKSSSTKNLVIITNDNSKFLNELDSRLHYRKDSRIKFVGTVYDSELLMKIRENAYGYFHGHEVGGTNPSLLEALGSTDLNFLLDVDFNSEVAEDAAFYWTKDSGSLASLIDEADAFPAEVRTAYGIKAKKRIQDAYSWQYIADEYMKVFDYSSRYSVN